MIKKLKQSLGNKIILAIAVVSIAVFLTVIIVANNLVSDQIFTMMDDSIT